jgi:hypothetical protein
MEAAILRKFRRNVLAFFAPGWLQNKISLRKHGQYWNILSSLPIQDEHRRPQDPQDRRTYV